MSPQFHIKPLHEGFLRCIAAVRIVCCMGTSLENTAQRGLLCYNGGRNIALMPAGLSACPLCLPNLKIDQEVYQDGS